MMMLFSYSWKSLVLIINILILKTNAQSPSEEKPGVCPDFNIPSSDLCVIECNLDSECPGSNKCCSLISCGSICTSPLVPTTSPNFANSTTSENIDSCKNECDNSRQCGTFSLCIREGCKRVCKSFGKKKPVSKQKPKAKPTPITKAPENCTDECLRNAHCRPGFNCITKGCRNVCQMSSKVSEDCTDKCLSDTHCPLEFNCIKQGCRYICVKTENSKNEINSPILPNRATNIQSTRCFNVCLRDTDCSQGSICVQQGCNTFCRKQRQRMIIKKEKSIMATNQRQEGLSTTNDCTDECKLDVDCGTWMNCKRRGCRRVCTHAKQTMKSNNTSFIKASLFESDCQSECNVDMDCSLGFSCRQIGCKRVCQKDDVGLLIDRNSKQQRTDTNSGFSNCNNQCKRDSECRFGEFCTQKGCRKECVKKFDGGFISTTSAPFTCRDECKSDRDCDIGYTCIMEGCKFICQRYQQTRNSDRVHNLICEIECNIDADCLVGQMCEQDGCNKLCNAKPVVPSQSARDRLTQQSSTDTCSNQCLRDSDCSQNTVCRRIGCKNICLSYNQNLPSTNQNQQGMSQSNNQVVNRFQSSGFTSNTQRRQPACRVECTSNRHCPIHTTCIQVGCDRTCENQQLGSFNQR